MLVYFFDSRDTRQNVNKTHTQYIVHFEVNLLKAYVSYTLIKSTYTLWINGYIGRKAYVYECMDGHLYVWIYKETKVISKALLCSLYCTYIFANVWAWRRYGHKMVCIIGNYDERWCKQCDQKMSDMVVIAMSLENMLRAFSFTHSSTHTQSNWTRMKNHAQRHKIYCNNKYNVFAESVFLSAMPCHAL